MNKKLFIILISVFLLFSISSVNASERITASPGDTFAFYGIDNPAAESYRFAIVVDKEVYYFDNPIASELAEYSQNFGDVYYQVYGKTVEGFYDFENDKTFEFKYKSGQHVGYNDNAKVITEIYLN